jgi:DNA-binding winged helix-turn-helix (wHTH) protein
MRYCWQIFSHPVCRATIVEQVWRLDVETMTDVVDVYVNYLRRKVDAGYDRRLMRTIRGTGYQIGMNGCVLWRLTNECCDGDHGSNHTIKAPQILRSGRF